MSDINFKGRVVLVTGSGQGLGKAYAKLFAARGAQVIINDYSREAADQAVQEISASGGSASANYDSVTNGKAIVDQIMKEYGRLDVAICNAGILRDKSFSAMTPTEWHAVQEVHVKGSFSVAHAAWPVMRKQKYGKIIMTSSIAGIYGSFGQANYSAAKFALVGLAKTLAKEGRKYGIHVNVIAPIAASAMTATIWPPELLKNIQPEHVAPVVAWLCHESCKETGLTVESGAGYTSVARWEESKGAIFKTDESLTPSAVEARWSEIVDFTNPNHPQDQSDIDRETHVKQASAAPTNKQGKKISYKDQVVVVTGGGASLGRAYALLYAKLGAKVVVNDIDKKRVESTLADIKSAGGEAIGIACSTEEGDRIIQAALQAYGTVSVVVTNAGNLRDKSFAGMTERDWDEVYRTHAYGTFAVCKAAWPVFRKNKYGRILTVSSTSGIYGNFGQANYAAGKTAVVGLARTLALEGAKYGIKANALVPTAWTNMTSPLWPAKMKEPFSADWVAAVVAYLTSQECQETGSIIEAAAGWAAKLAWSRTGGYAFSNVRPATPEEVRDKWSEISRFDEKATKPTSGQESLKQIMGNFNKS